MQPTSAHRLVRGIGRWDLVALTINTVVGAGIFGLPSRVYALTGVWSILAYLVCALLAVLIILCYAEVSSRFAETGGPYLYTRAAFGAFIGFEIGWLVWLARMTAYAALCNLFIGYLGFFWPDISTGWTRAVAITAVTLAFAAVNLLGVRESSLVGNVFTVGKLVPLILFVAIGAFFLNPGQFQHRVEVPRFGDFSTAVLLLLFAFSGFETAVIPSGEVREPQRHLPFGLLVGMCVVVLLYVSIQIVCIGTLPELEHSERPIVEASNRFLGTAGATCIMLGAFVSVAGTMNAIVLAAPRLLFAMAEHGQLPRGLAAVHPRFRTPHVAIVLTTLVMLVLTLQGTFVSSLTISTVSRLIAYTATCLALPVLRRRADRAPFHLPGGNMVAAAATVLSLWLLLHSPTNDLVAVAVVALLGLPFRKAGAEKGSGPNGT